VLNFEFQHKQMIYIVGVSIAFFLSLLLLSKKEKTQADKILTCWLLVIGIHLLLFYLLFSGISYRYPFTLGLGIPLPLVHGPFLFLYTASLTNQLDSRKKIWLLHFIPAVASWIYLIRYYILPPDQKVFIFQHQGIGFETFMQATLVAIVLSGISYVIGSLILLKRHRKAILDQFSYTEKINLRWLQFLIYGIAFIWILVLAKDEILYAGVVVFVVLIGYFGIKQPGIFTTQRVNGQLMQLPGQEKETTVQPGTALVNQSIEEGSFRQVPDTGSPDRPLMEEAQTTFILEDNAEKRKYSKSGLTTEMAESLHNRLKKLMETEKIYTESELSLGELANRLNTLPNYLSQVINDKEGKNFYDYVNMLRIEEFKSLISRPENRKYTLLSLSYDCGFNSKSSFNKNFKKVTGLSPSEYLNNLNMERAA
jgi:AraC-like DNA-binding protein